MFLSKEKSNELWNRFLNSGKIEDYLKYKFHTKKKEEQINETDYLESGNRPEDNRL